MYKVVSRSWTFVDFVTWCYINKVDNECADEGWSGADGGRGAGARERDGRAAARQDCGEDI